MRRLLGVLLVAVFAASCNGIPDIPWPPDPPATEPYDCENPPDLAGRFLKAPGSIKGRVIVVLREQIGPMRSLSDVRSVAQRFEALTDVRVLDGQFAALMSDIAVITALLADPDVLYISQEQTYTTSELWNLDRVDQRDLPLDDSFAPEGTGEGIHIDIIDTGVTDHPDFGGRLIEPCHTEHTFRGCNDGNGHGTHVAGTAAGAKYGIAKGAWLHAIRVLGDNGSGTTSQVIAGINKSAEWARANGPRIANMSLGGPADPPLDQAVCNAIDAGVIFALAAGNDSEDPYGHSPARVMQAITMGASNRNDEAAYFSNKGPGIDLWAPGVGITSAKPGGGSQTFDGTSMASPHAAGAAALYLEQHPGAMQAEVAAGLVAAASQDKLSGIGSSPNLLLYVEKALPEPTPDPCDADWVVPPEFCREGDPAPCDCWYCDETGWVEAPACPPPPPPPPPPPGLTGIKLVWLCAEPSKPGCLSGKDWGRPGVIDLSRDGKPICRNSDGTYRQCVRAYITAVMIAGSEEVHVGDPRFPGPIPEFRPDGSPSWQQAPNPGMQLDCGAPWSEGYNTGACTIDFEGVNEFELCAFEMCALTSMTVSR